MWEEQRLHVLWFRPLKEGCAPSENGGSYGAPTHAFLPSIQPFIATCTRLLYCSTGEHQEPRSVEMCVMYVGQTRAFWRSFITNLVIIDLWEAGSHRYWSSASVFKEMQSSNPYRREVLAWYHKIVKSAFTVPWTTDEDAMYILSESRRLFRANQHITDLAAIRRKIDEAEMRYGIAVHYLIPYPRPSHKTQGSTQESGIAYHPAFDSLMDSAKSPLLGDTREGTATMAFASGSLGESASRMRDGFSGMDDTLDGLTFQKPFEP